MTITWPAVISKRMMELQMFKANIIISDSEEVRAAKLKQLERRKERDERLLDHVEKELAKINETLQIAAEAKISVNNTAFASTVIRIDDQETELKTDEKNVEFFRENMMEGISRRPAV